MIYLLSILSSPVLQQDDAGGILALLTSGVGLFCSLIFVLLLIASLWRIFTKAGQPGWAAIVPIYNIYVLLQIVGRPGWWLAASRPRWWRGCCARRCCTAMRGRASRARRSRSGWWCWRACC